jgi:hypothetical protein
MANNGEFYAIFSPMFPNLPPRTICSHATLKSSSFRLRISRSFRSLFNCAICRCMHLMPARVNILGQPVSQRDSSSRTMYPCDTLSTKKLLSFIRPAIPLFAAWFLDCLLFRFARFLQQSSHPILVPQSENRQSHEFRWANPDASVETLTGYSEPLG